MLLFGGVGEVVVDALGDDVAGGLVEVGVEEIGEFQKLRPEDGIDEGLSQ